MQRLLLVLDHLQAVRHAQIKPCRLLAPRRVYGLDCWRPTDCNMIHPSIQLQARSLQAISQHK